MKTTAFGHVDADCFYVGAERARDGFLVGKPVAVLGNQGACVIAKSYEMKAMGVKTGEPIWDAIPKCPDGIYVKRDFHWYDQLSQWMLDCVKRISTRVEYYSIDEFSFLAKPRPGQDFQGLAEALRDQIRNEVGVPVTVGIARSRLLAKLLCKSAKPFGAEAVLDKEGEERLMADRPVEEITGIAGRRAKQLLPWGIRTCLDLARADRRKVKDVLTIVGEAMWYELNGHPTRDIHPVRPLHKALSRGGSFGESTADPVILYAWLVRNVERMVEELTYYKTLTGRLTVWVGYKDGLAGQGQLGLDIPTGRFDLLLDAARPCLRKAWIPRAQATRMQVIAERLRPRADGQRDLFEPPGAERAETLAKVKREINTRVGRFSLRSGATLPLAAIYRDSVNSFDICDIRGKICF